MRFFPDKEVVTRIRITLRNPFDQTDKHVEEAVSIQFHHKHLNKVEFTYDTYINGHSEDGELDWLDL